MTRPQARAERPVPAMRVHTPIAAFLAPLLLLCASSTADAQVVRLVLGDNTWGHGWQFLDTDGRCKVVTAAHVVTMPGGQIVRDVMIYDAGKRQYPAGAAELVDGKWDIAVLLAPAGDPSECGSGRLSVIGVDRRVEILSGATIETTAHEGARLEVAARRTALGTDQTSGRFSVQPLSPTDKVVAGWSGSVVRDADGLLGVVTEARGETNEANAVRVDVIRRLIDAQPRPAPAATVPDFASTAIVVLAGSTPDPASGPGQAMRAGSWRVLPTLRQVVFMLYFSQPRPFHGIHVAFRSGAGNFIQAVGAAVTDAATPEDWLTLNYCKSGGDGGAMDCIVNGTADRIRITLDMANDGEITLSSLLVQ